MTMLVLIRLHDRDAGMTMMQPHSGVHAEGTSTGTLTRTASLKEYVSASRQHVITAVDQHTHDGPSSIVTRVVTAP